MKNVALEKPMTRSKVGLMDGENHMQGMALLKEARRLLEQRRLEGEDSQALSDLERVTQMLEQELSRQSREIDSK